jgi:hypothetical protein
MRAAGVVVSPSSSYKTQLYRVRTQRIPFLLPLFLQSARRMGVASCLQVLFRVIATYAPPDPHALGRGFVSSLLNKLTRTPVRTTAAIVNAIVVAASHNPGQPFPRSSNTSPTRRLAVSARAQAPVTSLYIV